MYGIQSYGTFCITLCLPFAKPTFESYKLLTKLFQSSKLNFNIEAVSYFKCKVKGNYKKSDVVLLSEGVNIRKA